MQVGPYIYRIAPWKMSTAVVSPPYTVKHKRLMTAKRTRFNLSPKVPDKDKYTKDVSRFFSINKTTFETN